MISTAADDAMFGALTHAGMNAISDSAPAK